MTDSAPVALVTGGARRLGAAIIRALHQRGFNVVIHYRNHESEAEQLIGQLNALRPDSAIGHRAELTEPPQVAALATAAQQRWGRLDALVNNASAFYPHPTASATLTDWDRIMNSNLRAPFLLLQHCLDALQCQGGCVVNLIDIYAERPLAEHPLYCASKAGLAMLTRSWARDLGPTLRVNGVSPGAILWPEHPAEQDDSHQQQIIDSTPLHRSGEASDIAGAVAWLVCDAPFVNGQIIAVDGGRSLNM